MKIHYYATEGGKNLIFKYLDELQNVQKAEGYAILKDLEVNGLAALDGMDPGSLKESCGKSSFTGTTE